MSFLFAPGVLLIYATNVHYLRTGFPKKDARFLEIKNFPDLLCDDKEGKLMGNFDV